MAFDLIVNTTAAFISMGTVVLAFFLGLTIFNVYHESSYSYYWR